MWVLLGKFAGTAVLTYLVIGSFSLLKSGVWTIDFKIFWAVVLSMAILNR